MIDNVVFLVILLHIDDEDEVIVIAIDVLDEVDDEDDYVAVEDVLVLDNDILDEIVLLVIVDEVDEVEVQVVIDEGEVLLVDDIDELENIAILVDNDNGMLDEVVEYRYIETLCLLVIDELMLQIMRAVMIKLRYVELDDERTVFRIHNIDDDDVDYL